MKQNDIYAFDRLTKHYSNEVSRNHMYMIWFNLKNNIFLLMQNMFYKFKYFNDFIIIDD